MDLLDDTEVAFYAARYMSANGQATLEYAVRTAVAYADAHASSAPPAIREGVAKLHLRYALSHDRGDKALLRFSIDALLGIGGERCSL